MGNGNATGKKLQNVKKQTESPTKGRKREAIKENAPDSLPPVTMLKIYGKREYAGWCRDNARQRGVLYGRMGDEQYVEQLALFHQSYA